MHYHAGHVGVSTYPPHVPAQLRGQKKAFHGMSVSDQTPYQSPQTVFWQVAADIGGSNRACIFNGCDSISKEALIGLGWRGCKKFLHLNKSTYIQDRYTYD